MINLTVIAVGSLKERFWRDACAEYQKRLSAFCRIELIEIAEERAPQDPSEAQKVQVIEAEGRRIAAKIPASAAVIALCIEGEEMTSLQLAAKLESLAVNGVGRAALVIGGSFGLWDEVKRRAVLRLSFSPMTFPHQLARVMLLEQVYRAMKIAAGERYHK